MIVAIDGPAASGKGTIARRLAAHYGLPHLDTGLLYRATDLPHWRNAQPDGHTSSVCFFHFMPEEFEGNLD